MSKLSMLGLSMWVYVDSILWLWVKRKAAAEHPMHGTESWHQQEQKKSHLGEGLYLSPFCDWAWNVQEEKKKPGSVSRAVEAMTHHPLIPPGISCLLFHSSPHQHTTLWKSLMSLTTQQQSPSEQFLWTTLDGKGGLCQRAPVLCPLGDSPYCFYLSLYLCAN